MSGKKTPPSRLAPDHPPKVDVGALDLPALQRLAESLKVPPAYLFADDPRLARMILAFDRLSPTQQDQLLRSIISP